MSRHWNEDFKVLSIQAIFVTLYQLWKWFTCWENFENHHPEKFSKISYNCKEVICGGIWFYISTILLQLTVILFHGNLKGKVISIEQKVTSNEQKVTSNKQKVTSSKEKRTSNEQIETSNEQNVTSNKQILTSKEQKVTSNEQKLTSHKQQAKGSASLTLHSWLIYPKKNVVSDTPEDYRKRVVFLPLTL